MSKWDSVQISMESGAVMENITLWWVMEINMTSNCSWMVFQSVMLREEPITRLCVRFSTALCLGGACLPQRKLFGNTGEKSEHGMTSLLPMTAVPHLFLGPSWESTSLSQTVCWILAAGPTHFIRRWLPPKKTGRASRNGSDPDMIYTFDGAGLEAFSQRRPWHFQSGFASSPGEDKESRGNRCISPTLREPSMCEMHYGQSRAALPVC